MRLLPFIGVVLSLVVASLGRSSTGSSVLVILEPKLAKEDYSLFFDGLTGQCVGLDLLGDGELNNPY
jgi:oligosaccharyltransferase complex subunit beta